MKQIDRLEYEYLKSVFENNRTGDSPYTDLAVEATEMVASRLGQTQMTGVQSEIQQLENGTLTRVRVTDPRAGQQLGKTPGVYITYESNRLRERDRDYQEIICKALGKELHNLIGIDEKDTSKTALVVGLGNWNATPDALGPKVVNKLLITRHLIQHMGSESYPGLRPVCAIAPGVLGITGMETAEIVQGIVEKVKPDLVIVVDALASRSSNRVGATIQMADTGIHPGAGIGNKRFGLTRESLKVPVFAIGVPTVVEAITLVSDAMDQLSQQGKVTNLGRAKDAILHQVLSPFWGSLVMTPKEIDVLVDDMGKVVANIINIGLHPQVDPEEFFRYSQ